MIPGEPPNKRDAAPLPRIVLVDANIFFSPRMRDVFMHLHESEVINVHWTREIEAEWTRNVIEKQNANQAGIEQCLRGMREAAEGWEVNGYEKYLDLFEAVDKKDRHVAAAAHKLSLVEWPGQTVALITGNLSDFPLKAFENTQVVRLPPAEYLELLFAEDAKRLLKILDGCRKKLKAPTTSKEEYVAILFKNGCRALAQEIAKRWSVECPMADKAGKLYYASDGYAGKKAKP